MKHFLLALFTCMLMHSSTDGKLHLPGMDEEKTGNRKDNSSNSSFSYDEMQQMLTINFIEAEMKETQPDVIEYMQTHHDYIFDSEFALPEELWKALGSQKPLIIKKGSYPVSYKDGVYTIFIQL